MAHWAGTAGSRIIAVSSLFEIRSIPRHFTGEKSFTALPSVGASLKDRVATLPVTKRAFYLKLNGIEPKVAAVLARDSVKQLAPVIRKLGLRTPLLPGFNIRVLDGNYFATTEHRLLETRTETAAPLPGQALAVLDPDLRLAVNVFPCEDGHTQERSLLNEVLLTVCRNDLWIADRNFCVLAFLSGIIIRNGRFVIRHHASMPIELVGRRTLAGTSETGRVYEQKARITNPATGRIKTIRCVSLVLKTPTRDGETKIRILTNLLMKAATALKVADLSTHAQVKWHNRRNHNQGTNVPRSPGTRRAASLRILAWNSASRETSVSGYYLRNRLLCPQNLPMGA